MSTVSHFKWIATYHSSWSRFHADLVIDFIGGRSAVEPLLTCIRALKYCGNAVFVGNIEASIPLTYSELTISILL
jgi:hypothetical protein